MKFVSRFLDQTKCAQLKDAIIVPQCSHILTLHFCRYQ